MEGVVIHGPCAVPLLECCQAHLPAPVPSPLDSSWGAYYNRPRRLTVASAHAYPEPASCFIRSFYFDSLTSWSLVAPEGTPLPRVNHS